MRPIRQRGETTRLVAMHPRVDGLAAHRVTLRHLHHGQAVTHDLEHRRVSLFDHAELHEHDPDLRVSAASQDENRQIDDQAAHLFKHAPLGIDDVYEIWQSDPLLPRTPAGSLADGG